jgi:thiol-disulfide isomerase/thioredoxin
MALRWTSAAAAAGVLAWTTMTAEMPWLDPAFEPHAPGIGASCPADAEPAPLDYTLSDLDGRAVRLADYRGQVILLNFWATWCLPCRAEIPWLVEFQERYAKAGLQVIGVAVDDSVERLVPYARDMQMNYPVLRATGGDAALAAAYGPLVGIPITVLISRDGKVCGKQIGLTAKDRVEQGIRALL